MTSAQPLQPFGRLAPRARARMAALLGLGLVALAVILPAAPPLHPVPYRDSGVFLYVGQQMLAGAMPYLDVWDHKPPGVHLLNSAGLLVAGGSRWGVWMLEALAMVSAAWIGLTALSRRFSLPAAVLATAAWLSAVPFVLEMGNCTEQYALPLQMAAIAVVLHTSEERDYGVPSCAALGAIAAALALLRPNLVGLPTLAMAVLLASDAVRRRWRSLARCAVAVLLGALVVMMPVMLWLAVRGAFSEFVQAVIGYNLAYSAASPANRLDALATGLNLTVTPGTLVFAAGGWLVAMCRLVASVRSRDEPTSAWLWFSAAALPLEFAAATMSGRDYPHYFLSVLPSCGLLAAILWEQVGSWARRGPATLRAVGLGVGLTVVGAGALLATREVYRQLVYSPPDQRALGAVSLIRDLAGPDEPVLVWGAETTLNYLSERRSPTRYVYLYPLLTRGFWRDEMVEELLSDLEQNPPRLIIDTSATNEIIPSLQPTAPSSYLVPSPPYEVPPSLDRVRAWIAGRYTAVAASDGWYILERSP